MTSRDLTAVLLALLGVYLLGNSITQAAASCFLLTLESSDESLRQAQFDQGLLGRCSLRLEAAFGFTVLWASRVARRRDCP